MGRKPVVTLVVGAALLIGAAAGFVIVPEHRPRPSGWGFDLLGWPRTVYDTARIGTWALLIVGAIAVTLGLINYGRRS